MERFEVGLIGTDISKSLSPVLHEAEAAAQGLSYRYTLIELDPENAGAELPGLLGSLHRRGFAGVNVTFPIKQAIIPMLDTLSPEAEAMNAVNTVRFDDAGAADGHNTDWWGFGESLRRGLKGASPGRVVLLGAGGAGAAAGYALGRMGAAKILVADRVTDRAKALVERLAAQGFVGAEVLDADRIGPALAAADGLVHATPTGMVRFPGLPVDPRLLHAGLWVAEIVYVPLETGLLRAARAAGCRAIDGGGMVVLQAARAMEIFTGRRPDVDRMLDHFARISAQ